VLAELDNFVTGLSSDEIAGDFDGHDDVDGSGIAVFAEDLANGCTDLECNWDLNANGLQTNQGIFRTKFIGHITVGRPIVFPALII
jgi:hypothetical protein